MLEWKGRAHPLEIAGPQQYRNRSCEEPCYMVGHTSEHVHREAAVLRYDGPEAASVARGAQGRGSCGKSVPAMLMIWGLGSCWCRGNLLLGVGRWPQSKGTASDR
jgi:hypothetical protein